MKLNHPKTKLNFLVPILALLVSGSASCQQPQKQLWFRPVQENNAKKPDGVVRVYYDKYGDYYPDLKVPMDSVHFFDPKGMHPKAEDSTSGNIYEYLKDTPQLMSTLEEDYHIAPSGDFGKDYEKYDALMVTEIGQQVHDLIVNTHAKNIVFLIHGFNDPDATNEYRNLRAVIKANGYEASAMPVYVEIYWDGLSAHGKNPALAGIWPNAQDNTRWICLSLRNLMDKLPDRLPITVITHSLGASIGTGALFNTMSKWEHYKDAEIDDQLRALQKTPTVSDVRIRLAMLAPAIPGVTTFMDFNDRTFGKDNIQPSKNNIDRIIIGYNPKDYATTKAIIYDLPILAGHFGATTLGCDYGSIKKGQDEISRVKTTLNGIGYQDKINQMVFPVLFHTAKANHGTEQHGLDYYIQVSDSMDSFLKDTFGN